MTLEDAKKVTQLLNAIEAEATLIRSLGRVAAVADTTRTLRHHVSELRQILDLRALVEQNPAQACVSLKLARHEHGTPSLVITHSPPLRAASTTAPGGDAQGPDRAVELREGDDRDFG